MRTGLSPGFGYDNPGINNVFTAFVLCSLRLLKLEIEGLTIQIESSTAKVIKFKSIFRLS